MIGFDWLQKKLKEPKAGPGMYFLFLKTISH
jgi:hypothetical protein